MPLGFDKPHSWLRDDDDFDRYNKPGSSDWFSLSGDVSIKKPNNRHDALKVESLLGYGGYMDIDKSGGPLGLSMGTLEKPIKAFQAKNGLEVDGWLKPGGPTIKKMKELYGGVFGGTPAPTPAMMDAHVEKRDAGEDGFLHDEAPKFGVKPNRRLDAKAHLMEYERWNRDWARGSGDDPKGLAPEYESYIRDLDKDHGHDPGLIFARDLTQQVERYHGKGGELAKQFVTLLADRPDLQREYLGGEVPKAPPIGTFKPGGEEGVKAWIDQDRVANGLKPRYAIPISTNTRNTAPAAQDTPDPKNLLEYGPNFGLPEDGAPAQTPETDDPPVTRDDLRPNARAILEGMENSRREPGVQIAMAPGAIPPRFAFEPIDSVDVTQFDGAWSKAPAPSPAQPAAAPAQADIRRTPPFVEPWPDRVPQVADELPAMGPDGTRLRRPIAMPEERELTNVAPEEFAEIYKNSKEDDERANAEVQRLTEALAKAQEARAHSQRKFDEAFADSLPQQAAEAGGDALLEEAMKAKVGLPRSNNPVGIGLGLARDIALGNIEEKLQAGVLAHFAQQRVEALNAELERVQNLQAAHNGWRNRVDKEKERRQRANP